MLVVDWKSIKLQKITAPCQAVYQHDDRHTSAKNKADKPTVSIEGMQKNAKECNLGST